MQEREDRHHEVSQYHSNHPFQETHKPGWLGSAEVDIEDVKFRDESKPQTTAVPKSSSGIRPRPGAPTGELGVRYTPTLDEDDGGLKMAAFPARVPFKSFLKDYSFLKYDLKLSEEMLDAIYSIDDTLVDVETLRNEERQITKY